MTYCAIFVAMKKTIFLTLILFFCLAGCQTEEFDRNGDDDDYDYEIIRPVETFDLIGIRYEFLPGDSFSVIPVVLSHRQVTNNSDTIKQVTLYDDEVFTIKSSFSKPTSKDVSIIADERFVRIPRLKDRQIDTSVLVGSQWTFTNGDTERRDRTFQGSSTLQIPPQVTIAKEVVAFEYHADITYIATLRSRVTSRVIEVTGRWKGVIIYEIKVHIYHPNEEIETTRHKLV